MNYQGKYVLVAGGTGTIGIAIVNQLLKLGCQITIVSLDPEEYVQKIFGNAQLRFIHKDLRDYGNCLEVTRNMDFVFDMTGIKGSIGSNAGTLHKRFVSYLRFQANLMDAAYQNNVSRYLFAGSICSYPARSEPKSEEIMWDGLPLQNDKYAGIAKRVGEAQAMTYAEDHVWDAVRIIRFPNVYGPNDDFNPNTAQVIPALIARMEAGENPLRVWGDGSQIRDFLFVEDAAYWAIQALILLPPFYPVNLGGVHVFTIREIVQELCSFYPDVRIVYDAAAPIGDPTRILDNTKAKTLLNFSSKYTLHEALEQTIKWYKTHKDIAMMKGKFYGN